MIWSTIQRTINLPCTRILAQRSCSNVGNIAAGGGVMTILMSLIINLTLFVWNKYVWKNILEM